MKHGKDPDANGDPDPDADADPDESKSKEETSKEEGATEESKQGKDPDANGDPDADDDADADADESKDKEEETPKEESATEESKEEEAKDPHLYLKEEEKPKPSPDNDEVDEKAKNQMNEGYLGKLQQFQDSAGSGTDSNVEGDGDAQSEGDAEDKSGEGQDESGTDASVSETDASKEIETNDSNSVKADSNTDADAETATEEEGKGSNEDGENDNAADGGKEDEGSGSVAQEGDVGDSTTDAHEKEDTSATAERDENSSENGVEKNGDEAATTEQGKVDFSASDSDADTVENKDTPTEDDADDNGTGADLKDNEGSEVSNKDEDNATDGTVKKDEEGGVSMKDAEGKDSNASPAAEDKEKEDTGVEADASAAAVTDGNKERNDSKSHEEGGIGARDESEKVEEPVVLDVCESNTFQSGLELSLEEISELATKYLDTHGILEATADTVSREEEAEHMQNAKTNLRRRYLSESKTQDEVSNSKEFDGTVRCKAEEISKFVPGMCGGGNESDKIGSKNESCEYYVAFARREKNDANETLAIHLKLLENTACKINVIALCADESMITISPQEFMGNEEISDSQKERLIVHENSCLFGGEPQEQKEDDSLVSSIVAKPTPTAIDMLFVDMKESELKPSWFLNSIVGERLLLFNTTSMVQQESVYLPKQVVFYGIEDKVEFSLKEDEKIQMLSKGYVYTNAGPMTFMRYACPKPPSDIGGSAAFITSGFPV